MEDYLYWQNQDKKTLKRINQLLLDIDRNGYEGIGKPEPLKHDYTDRMSYPKVNPYDKIIEKYVKGKLYEQYKTF